MQLWKCARALVGRFAVGAATTFSIALGLIAVAEPRGLSFVSLGAAALELVMLAGGYVLPQLALNRRRREGWEMSRSHVFFGLSAPLAIAALSTQVQGVNLAGIVAISFGTGAALGLMQLLFTLHGPRPRVPTLEEQAAAIDAEMARLDLLIDKDSSVIPIERPAKEPQRTPEQVA